MGHSVTGLNGHLQSPAAQADLGYLPSSVQRDGANIPQDTVPSDIFLRTWVMYTMGPRSQRNYLHALSQK